MGIWVLIIDKFIGRVGLEDLETLPIIKQDHDDIQKYIDEDEKSRRKTTTFGNFQMNPLSSSENSGIKDRTYLAPRNYLYDMPMQTNKLEKPELPLSYSDYTAKKNIQTSQPSYYTDSYERIKEEMREEILSKISYKITKELLDKIDNELEGIINQAKKEVTENVAIIQKEINNKLTLKIKELNIEAEEKHQYEVNKLKSQYIKYT